MRQLARWVARLLFYVTPVAVYVWWMGPWGWVWGPVVSVAVMMTVREHDRRRGCLSGQGAEH